MINLGRKLYTPKHARIRLYRNIIISPKEVYRQISNIPEGISFDGSACNVSIVDCHNNVILDITDKVYISEFIHDTFGTPQIAYEIAYVGAEYGGRELFLRFQDENNPINVWYSQPINFTATQDKDSVIFDYWATSTLMDIPYLNSENTKQRIRVGQIYSTGRNNPSERVTYNQRLRSNGNIVEIGAKFQRTKQRNFRCYHITDDVFDSLQTILAHDIVYIDGIRVTNKPVMSDAEYIGQTNMMTTDFVGALNEADVYDGSAEQLKPKLQIIEYVPFGTMLFSNAPDVISATFNYPIELGVGTLSLYDSDGLIQEFTQDDITISGNTFTINFTDFGNNTSYYVLMEYGLIVGFEGISNNDVWTFRFSNGNYSSENYSSTNYFTD